MLATSLSEYVRFGSLFPVVVFAFVTLRTITEPRRVVNVTVVSKRLIIDAVSGEKLLTASQGDTSPDRNVFEILVFLAIWSGKFLDATREFVLLAGMR